MSDLLHFSEHTLQEVALGFMALVYIMRITWFLRFKAGKERQPATGFEPLLLNQQPALICKFRLNLFIRRVG